MEAHELRARAHDVTAIRAVAAPAAADVQQGVVGDVAGHDGFAVGPGAGKYPGGHQRRVLQDFLGILGAHEGNVLGDQVAEAGDNFINEDGISMGTHGDLLG